MDGKTEGPQVWTPFYVMNVRRPILSVGALCKKGFQVTFPDGNGAELKKDARIVHAERRGSLYFLEALFATRGMAEVLPVSPERGMEDRKEAVEDSEGEDASAPRVPKRIAEPTDKERAAHAATRVPFRAWRAECAKGRGAEGARRRSVFDPTVPAEVQFYHLFLGVTGEESVRGRAYPSWWWVRATEPPSR